MKEFKYKSEFGEYDVNVLVRQYETSFGRPTLAIELVAAHDDEEEEIYAGEPVTTLTVNMPDDRMFCSTFIDVNNASGAEKFLEENKLAKPIGVSRQSGFCSYPLYYFDAEALAEADPEGFAEYRKAAEACAFEDVKSYYDEYAAEFQKGTAPTPV